ncbi:AbrB/MazE/SpoVT family DNA-binding domain-containing protein [Candidatus Collierbacteria bacterium]|nr:AbrB/MazE/SpoVT family DNA-binding domain-containing protein [Candidatus Collierbacteria bacterium]
MQTMLSPTIQSVSTKGQIVIPKAMRQAMGLEPNAKVMIRPFLADRKIELSPAGNSIEELTGILKGWKKTATQIKRQIRAEEVKFEAKKQQSHHS